MLDLSVYRIICSFLLTIIIDGLIMILVVHTNNDFEQLSDKLIDCCFQYTSPLLTVASLSFAFIELLPKSHSLAWYTKDLYNVFLLNIVVLFATYMLTYMLRVLKLIYTKRYIPIWLLEIGLLLFFILLELFYLFKIINIIFWNVLLGI